MSITGAADADGGEPTKVGVAITDVVSGMLGAVSVLAALVGRERGGPGAAGQRIDVSLLGATLASLVNQAQNAFVGGAAPGRQGNAHPNIVPYETFATSDGEIAVAVGSERQWPRFCEAVGLAGAAGRPPIRDERRSGRAPGRVAPDPRRSPADALDRVVAGRAGRRGDPGRDDPRHRRGIRLAGGGRARDDRRDGAPGLGRDPPGRGARSSCRRRPRRSGRHRRCWARGPARSSRSSATTRRRSPGCGRPASSERTPPTAPITSTASPGPPSRPGTSTRTPRPA